MNAWLTFGINKYAVHLTFALNRTDDDDEPDDDDDEPEPHPGDAGSIESLVERADIEPVRLGFVMPRPRRSPETGDDAT